MLTLLAIWANFNLATNLAAARTLRTILDQFFSLIIDFWVKSNYEILLCVLGRVPKEVDIRRRFFRILDTNCIDLRELHTHRNLSHIVEKNYNSYQEIDIRRTFFYNRMKNCRSFSKIGTRCMFFHTLGQNYTLS